MNIDEPGLFRDPATAYDYRGVTIDQHVLALLPVDGQLTTNLRIMRISSDEPDIPAGHDEDPYTAHLGSTFLSMTVIGVSRVTEQETINRSIVQSRNTTVGWLSTTGNPINEFTTESLIKINPH